MNKIFNNLIFILIISQNLLGQPQSLTSDLEHSYPLSQPSMTITVNISLEDAEKKFYSISWDSPLQDTIKDMTGNNIKELFCFVRDSKGIVGFYRGLSTPMTYCDFQTNDTVIDVFFQTRPKANYTQNGIMILTFRSHCDLSEFKKIRLSVNNTKKKIVTLENNPDLIALTFKNKGAMYPDNMPCLNCCGFDMVICLHRTYLSLQTGKILTGNQWINRRSIKKIVSELELYQIDPSKKYYDKKQTEYLGADLIKTKKIALTEFDLGQFKNDTDNFPY